LTLFLGQVLFSLLAFFACLQKSWTKSTLIIVSCEKNSQFSAILICAVCEFVSTWLSFYPISLFFPDIPIVCMISINSLQEISDSPLPCGHSPSRPRLRHPLLCYTVPCVIHLALPRFSRTGRIPENSLSLTVEASLRISLPRHPSGLCYLNTTYYRRSWLTTGFTWLSSSHFSCFSV
jgi:hypothetical protein